MFCCWSPDVKVERVQAVPNTQIHTGGKVQCVVVRLHRAHLWRNRKREGTRLLYKPCEGSKVRICFQFFVRCLDKSAAEGWRFEVA
jgi:hypothetical protein